MSHEKMKQMQRNKSSRPYTGLHFKEKTLAEIGFNTTNIPLWDETTQPQKPDLYVLLSKMIKNYESTNVQIQIDETIFNCHMMVLQCYSDYFADKTLEHTVMLPSNKVTPQAFIMIYNWMLSAEPKVQREGILELFNAAQFLRIKALIDQCWLCLDNEEMFCEDAAFLLYMESRSFDHDLLNKLMLHRICKFFLTLVASKEFLEMTAPEICMLLSSNSIGVNSETEVLFAAVRWLNHDLANRERHLLEVISCVRFGLMAPWQLVELSKKAVSPELEKIVENVDVRKMIEDGSSYVTTKYWRSSNFDEFTNMMEKFKLTDPVDRQWVHDPAWIENYQCLNLMSNSYSTFLKYLEMVRSTGPDYWKSLKFHEGNPNKLLKARQIAQESAVTSNGGVSKSTPSLFAFKGSLPLFTVSTEAKKKSVSVIYMAKKEDFVASSQVLPKVTKVLKINENNAQKYATTVTYDDTLANYFEEIEFNEKEVKILKLNRSPEDTVCSCKNTISSNKFVQTDRECD